MRLLEPRAAERSRAGRWSTECGRGHCWPEEGGVRSIGPLAFSESPEVTRWLDEPSDELEGLFPKFQGYYYSWVFRTQSPGVLWGA